MSIPRLELQAALTGARLADSITKELASHFHRRIFWSDSRTVLCWIRSDPRSYQVFVANRLGEIDELTDNNTWRWIATDKNPADLATKVNRKQKLNLNLNGLWFKGPDFLGLPEREWDTQPAISKEDFKKKSSSELKPIVSHVYVRSPILPNPEKFSRWVRLLGATAKVFVAHDRWLKKIQRFQNVHDIERAELCWLREIQRAKFFQEIEDLKNNKCVRRTSSLLKFSPFLDEHGLIRADGRIRKVKNAPLFNNNPIILDGSHPVTRLILHRFHVFYNHGNTEAVMNEIR